jgi:hypothetical protein
LSEAEEPDGHPHETTTFDPLFLNATVDDDLLVAEFNTTEHKGFLHGFVESLSVILVSELGDKTFFIAAILAMRNNKLTVFLVRLEQQGVKKRCRLSLLTNSAVVVRVQTRGVGGSCGVSANEYNHVTWSPNKLLRSTSYGLEQPV